MATAMLPPLGPLARRRVRRFGLCGFCGARPTSLRCGQQEKVRACRNCAAVRLPELLVDAVVMDDGDRPG
jgi:hypothetical protein